MGTQLVICFYDDSFYINLPIKRHLTSEKKGSFRFLYQLIYRNLLNSPVFWSCRINEQLARPGTR